METAKRYVDSGDYLWNSGMFMFSTRSLIHEYLKHSGDLLRKVAAAMDSGDEFTQPSTKHYEEIPELAFDKAIMEKSDNVVVVPCDPVWSDIGSWESLWELREKDIDGNVIEGNAVCHGTRDCLIQAGKKLIACVGLDNLVVIETSDALLVANRSDSDSMRLLMKTLKARGLPETIPASALVASHAKQSATV